MRIPERLIPFFAAFLLLALPAETSLAQQGKAPDEMREANRAAAMLLSERLKRDRPEDYEVFCRIRRPDILVVRGEYDHIEWVLRDLGLPFTETTPEGLGHLGPRTVRAVLVNCPGRLDDRRVAEIRDFVRAGGYLFTTDWCVLHILEKAFPGYISYTRKPTRDDVVSIRVRRPTHVYLEHVLTTADRHLWWLESQSYPFTVSDRSRVQVLIDSEEMLQKYGAKPVAVTFPYGRGQVVHIISHSYLQRSELRSDRDRLAAPAFAGDLGFDEESEAMKKVTRAGLAGTPSGKLRSAYSAQQFLANFLIAAKRDAKPDPVRPPPPPPPPQRTAPPRTGPRASLAREARLLDRPDGEPLKLLPKGLPVRILNVSPDWFRVATPAGEEGWLPASALER